MKYRIVGIIHTLSECELDESFGYEEPQHECDENNFVYLEDENNHLYEVCGWCRCITYLLDWSQWQGGDIYAVKCMEIPSDAKIMSSETYICLPEDIEKAEKSAFIECGLFTYETGEDPNDPYNTFESVSFGKVIEKLQEEMENGKGNGKAE